MIMMMTRGEKRLNPRRLDHLEHHAQGGALVFLYSSIQQQQSFQLFLCVGLGSQEEERFLAPQKGWVQSRGESILLRDENGGNKDDSSDPSLLDVPTLLLLLEYSRWRSRWLVLLLLPRKLLVPKMAVNERPSSGRRSSSVVRT